jgi:hypothetical protein
MTKQEFQTIVAKKIVELKGYEVTPLEDKFSLIVKVEDKLSFQVNLSNFYLRFTKERNTLEEVIQVIINTISLSASKAKETETFEEVKNKLYPIVRDKGHLKQKPLNKNVNLKEVMLF